MAAVVIFCMKGRLRLALPEEFSTLVAYTGKGDPRQRRGVYGRLSSGQQGLLVEINGIFPHAQVEVVKDNGTTTLCIDFSTEHEPAEDATPDALILLQAALSEYARRDGVTQVTFEVKDWVPPVEFDDSPGAKRRLLDALLGLDDPDGT